MPIRESEPLAETKCEITPFLGIRTGLANRPERPRKL